MPSAHLGLLRFLEAEAAGGSSFLLSQGSLDWLDSGRNSSDVGKARWALYQLRNSGAFSSSQTPEVRAISILPSPEVLSLLELANTLMANV